MLLNGMTAKAHFSRVNAVAASGNASRIANIVMPQAAILTRNSVNNRLIRSAGFENRTSTARNALIAN